MAANPQPAAKYEQVIFSNPGLLDLRGLTVFGLSGKECDNPIGRFGTGLKYAIAILLRNELELQIWIDGIEHKFFTKGEDFRGKEIDMVYMNKIVPGTWVAEDVCMNFTTDLGSHWELWQAFRELYSNCLDESGEIDIITTNYPSPAGVNGQTVVVVTGDEFAQVAREKANIFVESQPVKKLKSLEIHEGATPAAFYNGIRVAEFDRPLMNKYNITDYVTLTEDRTMMFPSQLEEKLVKEVKLSDDPNFIAKVLTAPEDFYESTFGFTRSTSDTPSQTFLNTVKKLMKKGKDKVNPTAIRLYENFVRELRKERKRNGYKEQYIVELIRPKDVSVTEMKQYIQDAVSSWNGQFEVSNPLFQLERDEITIKRKD